MKSVMNKQELLRSKKLFDLLENYSEDLSQKDKEIILKQVNNCSVIATDIYSLDNYWRSMDLEEFCDMLAIEPIEIDTINEDEVNEGLRLIWQAEPQEQIYYLEKYSDVIENFYKRSKGTISNMIFWSDEYFEADINTIIDVLKSDDVVLFKVNNEICGKSTKTNI